MNLDRCLLFSWIEEDNIQKAYFRVRPLLTSEGDVRAEAEELWPAEGCLRIVPDRNEQHTFKTRMRSLGSYCVVDLRGLAADTGKIRTNKNFRPEKGEMNQYILYSDTVHELPPHSFYQIVDGTAEGFAQACEQAVTPRFFIREGDTLYGPVNRQAPAKPDPAAEAAGTLFELPCPDGQSRMILCMEDAPAPQPAPAPAAKPAKAAAPKEESAEQPSAPAEEKEASAEEAAEKKPDAEKPDAEEAPAAQTPAPAADREPDAPAPEAPAADAPLPIGKRLDILDQSKDFEETLQRLDKPVSKDANLLNQRPSKPLRPLPPPAAAKPGELSGTHLVRSPLRTSTPQPKNRVQEFVTNQMVIGQYEPPTGNLPAGTAMRSVENPVEAACSSLRQAWHATDAHEQLVDCILSLDGFRAKLEPRLIQGSGVTLLQKVLRDRLQDLEAERLTALCELDRAHRDVDAYKDELLGGLKHRIAREAGQLQSDRDECAKHVDSLKNEINALSAQRDALLARVEELQQNTIPAAVAKLIADAQMLAPMSGAALRMTPAAGQTVAPDALIDRLTAAFEASGLEADRNRAIALLVLLAASPRFGVVCASVAPLSTLTRNLAAAMGWTDSVVHHVSAEQRPVVASRPVDSAPAILMTSLQNYAPLTGVSKVILARSMPGMIRNAAYDAEPWPVMSLPALPFVDEVEAPADACAVSAASLAALLEKPCVDDAQLHALLDPVLKAAPPLSGAARKSMFRFVSVCAGLMEGGLPVAADWAILMWVIPSIDRSGRHYAPVKALLDEYPLSLAAL